MMDPRHALHDASEILSPSLLIYREIVRQNLQDMIALARGADRLRPHVKTHKMAEIVRLAESLGIRKHKCATIAEAEMVAAAGGTDVLLAYPLVGPNLKRFALLVRGYRAHDLPRHGRSSRLGARLVGGRAGTRPAGSGPGRPGGRDGPDGNRSRRARLPSCTRWSTGCRTSCPMACTPMTARSRIATGTHVADAVQPGLERTLALYDRLLKRGLPVPRLVVGGTPTFPIYAELDQPGVECSPGTCVLQDDSYGTRYPDLPFTPAALILTRVVSHPRPGRLCLDLGYKAVAADPTGPRARLLEIDDAQLVVHSEEHLVVETARAETHSDRNPAAGPPHPHLPERRPTPPRLRHRERSGRRPMGSDRPRSRAGSLIMRC